MNIQIFGTKKCFDTKKAIRYFKERNIKAQFIDLKEKDLSMGELRSIKQAVGGIDNLIDPDAKDKDALALIKYLEKMGITITKEAAAKCVIISSLPLLNFKYPSKKK